MTYLRTRAFFCMFVLHIHQLAKLFIYFFYFDFYMSSNIEHKVPLQFTIT